MQIYLLIATAVSIITLIVYFSLNSLNEKRAKPLHPFIMIFLRYILIVSVLIMMYIALFHRQ